MIVFGTKEDKEYMWRPAVYGVMFSELKDEVAVIRTSRDHYFLPGGGIENNESHEECLKREALEEMGMIVEAGQFIGCAQQYFSFQDEEKSYLNEGHFYLCFKVKELDVTVEDDHFLEWLDPAQAVDRLFHQHQSWAINEALKLFHNKIKR
jgi:8-oxo-dGTP diphosphatase